MKPFLLIACALVLAQTAVFAQGNVTLSGTIQNPKADKVYLSQNLNLLDYDPIILDSAVLGKSGRFSVTFRLPQKGMVNLAHGEEQASLYLSPNDKLTVTLNTEQFDESLAFTGKGATVNNYLAQKYLYEEKGQDARRAMYRLQEQEFVRFADSLENADLAFADAWFAKHKNLTPNDKSFFEQEKLNIRYQSAINRINYPAFNQMTTRAKTILVPSESYYAFLNSLPTQLKENDWPESYNGYLMTLNNFRVRQAAKGNPVPEKPFHLAAYEQAAKNYTGKERAFLQATALNFALSEDNSFSGAEKLLPEFRKESKKWPELITPIEQKYNQARLLAPGKPAPDFTAFTADGKPVKLSDFRGKVVYVDVWASWCGPCIMQIPFAGDLMKALDGENVVFLNVSVDADEAAWKKAMANHGVHGTNVLASGAFKSEIAKAYSIDGIPRYLLIDADGNIISSNARRPSSGAREQIEAALQKSGN